MSLMRRCRLERLEARRRPDKEWTDPYDTCMRLWPDLEAVAAGRASWVPSPELGPEAQQVFDLRMREADRMAERLRAERGGA